MKTNSGRNNIVGILYIILHALAVPLIYVIIKQVTKDIKVSHAIFFYKFTVLLFILPWIFKTGIGSLTTKKIHLHVIRAILSTAGSICVLQAVKDIGIIDVTAVTYLENVAMVAIGILIYKESVSYVKIFSITFSCIGMLIVLYPDLIKISLDNIHIDFSAIQNMKNGYFLLLIGVVMQLTNWIIIKQIGRTDTNKQQLFYITFLSSISSFFAAFTELHNVSILNFSVPIPTMLSFDMDIRIDHIIMIIATALCYLIHTVSIFKAMQNSELSVITPFDYTRLVFSGLYGFVFFNQIPHYSSYIGYTLIIISGIALIKAQKKTIN